MADLNALLQQANEADAAKNYAKAASLYIEILKTVPEEHRGKLQLYLGVSLFNQSKYAESVSAFDAAIESNDPEVLVNALTNKARAFMQTDQFAKAVEAFERLEKADPSGKSMRWNDFVHCLNQSSQYDRALSLTSRVLALPAVSADIALFEQLHNERIFAFFKLSRPLDSLASVEAILSKKPFGSLRPEQTTLYSEVLTQKAHDLMTKTEYTLALKYLTQVYDGTRSAQSAFLLGVCKLRMHNDVEAIAHLNEALTLCKTDPESKPLEWKIHVALGTCFMRPNTQDFAKATSSFTTAMKLSPEAQNPNVHFNNGYALSRLNRNEEAKVSLEFVFKHDPSNWIASAILGVIVLNEQNYEKAIEVLEHAIKYSNGDADDSVYYNLAYAYMMLNRYKEALANFKKALEKNPTNKAAAEAMRQMEQEIQLEEERKRKEEEERRKAEEERKRQEAEAEKARLEAVKLKNEESKRKAEELRKALEEKKEEEERVRKFKIQEARERRLKRLQELKVLVGGPQNYRARRPSLDLIPEGNTEKGAHKYADWYNEKIVKTE